MKDYLLAVFLVAMYLIIHGQKYAVGIFVNGIHNFNYYDSSSSRDETFNRSLYPIYEYGIEYSQFICKKNFGLYFSLQR